MKNAKSNNKLLCLFFLTCLFYAENTLANSYNSFGQVGLINLPTANTKDEQSIYLSLVRSEYVKLGTITATPFKWLEASYFYYRPDDLLWGSAQGLYLDKGFNVKFSYSPSNQYLPNIAIGLDDFAGTGQFTKEYIVSTYTYKNFKITGGMGWGKFVKDSGGISSPLAFISKRFEVRGSRAVGPNRGGYPSYTSWFGGDATIFGGIEFSIPKIRNLSFKLESDPFDYYKFGCCGEGLSSDSFKLRNKEANYNLGLSYQFSNFGNIDLSYIKGDTLNLSISLGFSSKKPIRKIKEFKPSIVNNNYNQPKKNEFYYDLLENLNANKLFIQTAQINESDLSITIDSEELINPIQYSSRASYVANEIAIKNNYHFKQIDVGLIVRGAEINNISYRVEDLSNNRLAEALLKKRTLVSNVEPLGYKNDDFQPKLIFPIVHYSISPDLIFHTGSPERFIYYGIGAQINADIQLSRNLTIAANIGRSFKDNFDEKASCACSNLEPVRTEIIEYLKQSKETYVRKLQLDFIKPVYKNTYIRVSGGYLEEMFAGASTEILFKPYESNFAVSYEFNKVQKRNYSGRFELEDYKTNTKHLNVAYYEPHRNMLIKWSYGKYLAKDKGYTLDLSRRMPSGWQAGVFFTITNVSSEDFGEGSFDKGFYFKIPLSIYKKNYSKNSNGFSLRPMTRDGGQKINIDNRLIDSFYGSSKSEINESWEGFLK